MKLNIPKTRVFATLAAVAAVAATYAWVPAVHSRVGPAIDILTTRDTHQAIEAFREYLLGCGAWAPAVSGALMVFQSVIAPLPAFIVTFTNGLLFGWAWGALLSWSSAMLGAVLCFWIARALGRPVVEKLAGGTAALEVSDLFFRRYGKRTVLIARVLPCISFDIISYGAGLTPISFGQFLIATGLGQLPATLLYSYLGERLTGSVRVLFWVFSITAVILVVGWTIRPLVIGRIRSRSSEETHAPDLDPLEASRGPE